MKMKISRRISKVFICVSFYFAQFFSYFNAYSFSINVSERHKSFNANRINHKSSSIRSKLGNTDKEREVPTGH